MPTFHSRRSILIGGGSIAIAGGCSSPPPINPAAPATAISGARWFNGESFETRDGWSVGGRFTFTAPVRVERRLDLAGAFLVPPFADAHSHTASGGSAGAMQWSRDGIAAYLRDGVFYAQSQGNFPLSAAEIAALKLNTPGGLDAALSNATLTGSADAGVDALAAFFQSNFISTGMWPGETLETVNNKRLIAMATLDEFEAKWPLVRAQKNDFIKVYLWNTDNAPFPGFPPWAEGKTAMPPEVFRAVVKRAHADGLRVSAHVTSAADVRLALDGGADMLAHTPIMGEFTADDAKACARSGIPAVVTMGMGQQMIAALPPPAREMVGAVYAKAWDVVRLLREHGANVCIGGDDPRDTTAISMKVFREMGWWSNLDLLRMWSVATPRAIYPNRMIGELSEGFEASFLALDGDPLADWDATAKIRMRFKQGEAFNLAA